MELQNNNKISGRHESTIYFLKIITTNLFSFPQISRSVRSYHSHFCCCLSKLYCKLSLSVLSLNKVIHSFTQSSICVLLTYASTGLTRREGCLLQYAPFDISKFSLAARLRGHKQRKVNYHVYSFLLSVSSGHFERSLQVLFLIVVLRVSSLKQGRCSIDSSTIFWFFPTQPFAKQGFLRR